MNKIASIIIALTLLLFTNTYALATEVPNPHTLLHGEVDIVASSCAAAGVTLSSLKFPTYIEKVRLGSAAIYAGIAKGDKVLSAEISNNKLSLLIERDGKTYYARLNICAQPSVKLSANQAVANLSTVKNERATQLKDLFVNHDLNLIVDRSGSMATPDCPDGLSRWQWCADQSADLAQVAASASSSITISFFNHTYSTWKNINPSNIPELFNEHSPEGNTLMAQPLKEQLDNYFTSLRLKPLIVLIISDGMPQDYANVADIFADASRQIKYKGEVTIIFLLIGNEINENQLRLEFGQINANTIQNGGMFDVIPFEKVSGRGIKPALFEELSAARQEVDTSKASHASQFSDNFSKY